MTYVITRSCCNDASCVEVCPVDCIHPTPDEPDFGTAEMLYVDPDECIDCGSCVDPCPVDAIFPEDRLPEHLAPYLAVNADYFDWVGETPDPALPPSAGPKATEQTEPLRVAVVGAGPAGWYVADELNRTGRADVRVTVLDRSPTPYGLVRYGVAPDHLDTKGVSTSFDAIAGHKRTEVMLNVSVGTDVSHDELLEHHHAVVYATGAATGRPLGIGGETLPGSLSAAELVSWYNGHADAASLPVALTHERAVVIGNGNVALDVARLMLSGPDALTASDMAPAALEALSDHGVEEVVVVGRRGAAAAAFTSPELRAIMDHPDFDVVVDPADVGDLPAAVEGEEHTAASYAAHQRADLLRAASSATASGRKRLVLRFGLTPDAILGESEVTGIRMTPTAGGDPETIEAGLVVRATGFRSTAVDGVPFDEEQGRFAHEGGRVLDPGDGDIVPGAYVVGWAKRGATGVIGSNRACATETARAVLDDYVAGRLPEPASPDGLADRLAERDVTVVGVEGWRAIDAAERQAGTDAGRPRVKIVDLAELVRVAGGITT